MDKDNPQVVITVVDLATMALNVTVTAPTLDYALNMLEQAKRNLQAEYNKAKHMEMMAELGQGQAKPHIVLGEA
jgi:hypothetical protein